jgi:hypothetical protein
MNRMSGARQKRLRSNAYALAVAAEVGCYKEDGRVVGPELQFPDGHRCCLAFDEIRGLEEGMEPGRGGQPCTHCNAPIL